MNLSGCKKDCIRLEAFKWDSCPPRAAPRRPAWPSVLAIAGGRLRSGRFVQSARFPASHVAIAPRGDHFAVDFPGAVVADEDRGEHVRAVVGQGRKGHQLRFLALAADVAHRAAEGVRALMAQQDLAGAAQIVRAPDAGGIVDGDAEIRRGRRVQPTLDGLPGREQVGQALETFKTSLSFDAVFYAQRLVDAVMHAEGVVTVKVVRLEHKTSAGADFAPVDVLAELAAGYFEYAAEGNTLTLTSTKSL